MKYRDLPKASLTTLREWAKPHNQQDPGVKDSHVPGRRNEFPVPFDFERMLRGVSWPVLSLQGDHAEGGMMVEEDVEYALPVLSTLAMRRSRMRFTTQGVFSREVAELLATVIECVHSL